MRSWQRIALGVSSVLGLAAALGLWLLLGETNLDRDQGDYRARMRPIWSGPAPGTPDTHSVGLDFDTGVLRYLFLNELDSEVPYLVAFPVPGAERAPALLLLPGGGYAFRSEKLDGLDVAAWLAEHGVAAFVLNYRVDPYRYPVPLLDAQRAMRWLRHHSAELHIDPQRLGVMGTSAGGHLAALLSTEAGAGDPASPDPVEHLSSKPDVAILIQAVISLTEHVHEGSRRHLLGATPDSALLPRLSADQRVAADTPPTLIWTSKTDEFVDYRNSESYAAALREHGVDHHYELFPEGHHGRGLARAERYTRAWPELCLAWLGRHGFKPEHAAGSR